MAGTNRASSTARALVVAARLKGVQESLYADAVKRGWFSQRPDRVRAKWYALGVLALIAAAGDAVMYSIGSCAQPKKLLHTPNVFRATDGDRSAMSRISVLMSRDVISSIRLIRQWGINTLSIMRAIPFTCR